MRLLHGEVFHSVSSTASLLSVLYFTKKHMHGLSALSSHHGCSKRAVQDGVKKAMSASFPFQPRLIPFHPVAATDSLPNVATELDVG